MDDGKWLMSLVSPDKSGQAARDDVMEEGKWKMVDGRWKMSLVSARDDVRDDVKL